LSGTAARSQNYRSTIASADSFDRYYRLSVFFCTIVLTLDESEELTDEDDAIGAEKVSDKHKQPGNKPWANT